ncbi:hypothetical protein BV20DRAFT_579849 [Pilatotrama ljubarskyi]|nr:hypothetical protein BV20DRAFT_579849 [Pilatotrama ljubarskyi]
MVAGVELALYFMTLRQVARTRRRTTQDKFLVVFSTVLLVLNTIYWTTQSYFGQQMWVVHADYPRGMNAYLSDNVAVWYQTWGSAAVMVSQLMADALLMHRLTVIWDNNPIVIVPAIIWFGSFVLRAASCLGLLYESGRPDGNYFAGIATKFGTAWNSLTFSFNVIVTSLICGRIIHIGRRLSGTDEGTKAYTGAVAIIVESALPFTLGNLAYVITYGMGSDIAIAFSWYSMFTAISPQLIALRVLTRRAWQRDSAASFMSTMNFSDRVNTTTHEGNHPEYYQEKKLDADSSMNVSTLRASHNAEYAV